MVAGEPRSRPRVQEQSQTTTTTTTTTTPILTTCAHGNTLCGTLTRPSMCVHQAPSNTLTFHHCWRCSGSDPHDSPGATLCVVLREQHCSLAEAADFAKVFLSSLTPSVVCALAAVGGTDATAAALSCVCCSPDRDVEATTNSPTALLARCRQQKKSIECMVSTQTSLAPCPPCSRASQMQAYAPHILGKTMLQSSIAAHRGGPWWWGYALTRSTLLRCPCLGLFLVEQFRAHVCTTEQPSPPLCVAAAASS